MGAASPRARPRITAAVCTYDRYRTLEGALRALAAQSLPAADYRILVIDNSPDRAAAEAFAARQADIPNLDYRFEARPGLSNARNVAITLAESPLLAFIDDDAIAGPQWLERLAAAFDEIGPGAAVVGGPVTLLWAAPRPPWLPDDLTSLLSALDWGARRRAIVAPREWLVGTNIAFRREALAAVGGFSVQLGRRGNGAALLSNEEIEVMMRIQGAGGTIHYEPGAAVEHIVHADRLTPQWFRRRLAWQRVSDTLAGIDGPRAILPAGIAEPLAELCADTDDENEFRRRLYDLAAVVEHLLGGKDRP